MRGPSCASFAARSERILVVRVSAPAARQIARARRWWRAHRDKAPKAFDDDLDELIARLEERPDLVGRPIEQRPAVRRVHLRRVRYYVYFRIAEEEGRVDVLALWHDRRGRGPRL